MGDDTSYERSDSEANHLPRNSLKKFKTTSIKILMRENRSIFLMWVEELTYKEIADVLDISRENVGQILYRIRKLLSQEFGGRKMEDQISKSDLNRMAQFDGEQPLYADLVDNEDHSEDLEKALMFSAQLREQLSTGIAKEPLPDAWIELIQDTKLVGAAQVETKVASPQASQPFALRLKQLLRPS